MTRPADSTVPAWIIHGFVLDAWNGRRDKLQAVLREYPEALSWQDPNMNGDTALMQALLGSALSVEYASFLLALGADPDIRNFSGWTALMQATRLGREDIVVLLLEQGADPAVKNHQDDTAQDIARVNHRRNLVELLQKAERKWPETVREREEAELQRRADKARLAVMEGVDKPVQLNRPLRLKSRRP